MSGPGSTPGGTSFECSLTGTVLPGQFRHLYDRLLGLCEHAAHSTMFEHELLFTPAVQRPMYAARLDEVHLKLRVKLTVEDDPDQALAKQKRVQEYENRRKRAKMLNQQSSAAAAAATTTILEDQPMASQGGLDASSSAAMDMDLSQQHQPSLAATTSRSEQDTAGSLTHPSKAVVSRQYQLCQYGHPEPGRNIVVRSAILVKIHGDAFGFLSLLGFNFEDEFVRRGYNFMYNNLCRISVYRKYKLSKQHDPFSAIVPAEEESTSATAIGTGSNTSGAAGGVPGGSTPIVAAAAVAGAGAGTGATGTLGGFEQTASSPWMVEITSSFVSQENVNSMSDEINIVRNLLTGSVAF